MHITEEILSRVPGLKTLKEPQTVGEALAQLAIISEAIEKCEKMLQYYALGVSTGGSGGGDAGSYLSSYRQLLAEQERLTNKRYELAATEHAAARKAEAQRPWWKPWGKRSQPKD